MAASRRRNEPAKPLPPILPLVLLTPLGMLAAWFGLPPLPLLWAGLLMGGVISRPPVAARKSDTPDPRLTARHRRWRDVLSGLNPLCRAAGTPKRDDDGGEPSPRRQWASWRRPMFWTGLSLWMLFPGGDGMWAWLTPLLDLPFGFMAAQGWVHMRDRRRDHAHPYPGVSIPAFWANAPLWARLTATLPVLPIIVGGIVLWTLGVTGHALPAVGAAILTHLAILTLADRRRQTSRWEDTVRMQAMIGGWVESDGSPLAKTWADAHVTSTMRVGKDDNPLHVIRVRVPDADRVLKDGTSSLRPIAGDAGWTLVRLAGARARSGGFDPRVVRLMLGTGRDCLPDITRRDVGVKVAAIVLEAAYAACADTWGSVAPLLDVEDVSDDKERAAWLVTLTMPTAVTLTDARVNVDWLADPDNAPSVWVGMDEFTDINHAFHLYADPDTPLSSKGNRHRTPGMVTESDDFGRYIALSRRFKADWNTWAQVCGKKPEPPSPLYDSETQLDGGRFQLTTLRMGLPVGVGVADYARLDLSPIDPDASGVMVWPDGDGMMLLTVTRGSAPAQVGSLEGASRACRLWAGAMLFRALVMALPAKAGVDVGMVSQEGRDVALWRAPIRLSNGATVADLRRKGPQVQSQLGVSHLYWGWRGTGEADVWMCDNPCVGVDDLDHWRNRRRQRQLIPLVLSDAWGEAGLSDREGRVPAVEDMSGVRTNPGVLRVRFKVPAGVGLARVDANVDRFSLAAGYAYARILPRGPEHGADLVDVLLASHDPFPRMASADWALADKAGESSFILGVDDMGVPVRWDVAHTPHLLVMGKTGTGKTSAVQIPVAEALRRGHRVVIIDPMKGGVDFTQWAKAKACAFVGTGRMREAEAAIGWVKSEMTRRTRLLSERGVGKIDELDAASRPPRLFVVWDEFNSYLGEMGRTTPNPLRDLKLANANAAISARNASIQRTFTDLAAIATQGRSAGVHLVLAGQRLTLDDFKKLGGNAFYKSLGRLLLGSDSPVGVVSQGNVREANRLQSSMKADGEVPVGRALYESVEGRLSAVQTWYGGGQSDLAVAVSGVPDAEPIDLSPFMPRETATFGRVREDELPPSAHADASLPDDGLSGLVEAAFAADTVEADMPDGDATPTGTPPSGTADTTDTPTPTPTHGGDDEGGDGDGAGPEPLEYADWDLD